VLSACDCDDEGGSGVLSACDCDGEGCNGVLGEDGRTRKRAGCTRTTWHAWR
jgi:hypothetical protein